MFHAPSRILIAGLCLSVCAVGCATPGSWPSFAFFNRNAGQPSPKLQLEWGKVQESSGKLAEARMAYEKVLEREPKNVEAILGMARLDVHAKRMVEAEEGYQRALTLKPKSAEVQDAAGQFYAEQQQWDKALPLLQSAMRAAPHNKTCRFHLAVALTRAGRIDEALPHFTESVGGAVAHYNVGRILVDQGQLAAAEQQFMQAVLKDPQLVEAQQWLDDVRQQRAGSNVQLTSASRPANGTRPPVTPHVGYEELPPPAVSPRPTQHRYQ